MNMPSSAPPNTHANTIELITDGTHAGHIFRLYPSVRGVAATGVLAG
jgi:hypothetical protein